MFPRCVSTVLSWRAVLVLTVLATVLQATTLLLSWRVSEAERQQQHPSLSQYQHYKSLQQPLPPHAPAHHHSSDALFLLQQPTQERNANMYFGDKSVSRELSSALMRLARQSVVDISGRYRVASAFLRPDPRPSSSLHGAGAEGGAGVLLATQCSPQHLHRLPHLARHWQGAVSVSVFALSHQVQWTLQTLLQLRRCHAALRSNVTFSIVTLIAPPYLPQHLPLHGTDRDLPTAMLAPLSKRRQLQGIYPHDEKRSDKPDQQEANKRIENFPRSSGWNSIREYYDREGSYNNVNKAKQRTFDEQTTKEYKSGTRHDQHSLQRPGKRKRDASEDEHGQEASKKENQSVESDREDSSYQSPHNHYIEKRDLGEQHRTIYQVNSNRGVNVVVLSEMDRDIFEKNTIRDSKLFSIINLNPKPTLRKPLGTESDTRYYKQHDRDDGLINKRTGSFNYMRYQNAAGHLHNNYQSGNLEKDYRYISKKKRGDGVVSPSPDWTPCGQVPDVSSLVQSSTVNKNSDAGKNYAMPGTLYPNNLLRNVAIEAAKELFVLVLDIDMMPSEGLHQEFIHFARKRGLLKKPTEYRPFIDHEEQGSRSVLNENYIAKSIVKIGTSSGNDFKGPNVSLRIGEKLAFVLPAYEISEDVSLPLNKADLIALVKENKARPFYAELCAKCQNQTDYQAWQNLVNLNSSSRNELEAAYEVLWRDPWEPFYISVTATVPRYDQRFLQYGFNRISQVCEAHVSGFRFVVLSSGFVVHRGLKRDGELHSSKQREQQHNRMLFRRFKQDLKFKYPHSSRRCY